MFLVTGMDASCCGVRDTVIEGTPEMAELAEEVALYPMEADCEAVALDAKDPVDETCEELRLCS